MTGPKKKIRVSDGVFCELLQVNKDSDISENEYGSDSEINVKISSGGEQDVSDNSSMQPDVWENFPFAGKPGINVDLEDPRNPLDYFELFRTPDMAEVIAREIGIPTVF
jgi:hypothetical protein